MLGDAWRQLTLLFRRLPEGQRPSALREYRGHALLSAGLFSVLFLLEGSLAYVGLSQPRTGASSWLLVIAAAAVAFAAILWSYAVACAGLRNRRKEPWFLSAAWIAGASVAGILLLWPLVPSSTHISSSVNAFPVWGIAKDVSFFWLFGWALLSNTFCATAALRHLAVRGQFLTLQRGLRWQSPTEAGLPLRCLVFPWEWGGLALLIVAIVLGLVEIGYYLSLRTDVPEASRAVSILLARDVLLIMAAVECLIFYKQGLADARRSLA
jgi:hypothetical protein